MQKLADKIAPLTVFLLALFALSALTVFSVPTAQADDDILIIEDDSNILIEDQEASADDIVFENDETAGSSEGDESNGSGESDELIIEDDPEETITLEQNETSTDTIELIDEQPSETVATNKEASTEASSENSTKVSTEESAPKSNLSALFDEMWVEYGNFHKSDASADHQGYAHAKATINVSESDNWEFQASARIDGYTESGDRDWDEVNVDYDETFIRFKTDNTILTLGAQKVLWGRIDEFPPVDRLSTQDLRRFVVDDLPDRRLASAAIRYEHFFGSGKIDAVLYPSFREAELPDEQSIWYPVNKTTGEILGLETTPALEAVVRNTAIVENAPDSEGGMGLRYTSLGSDVDYALSIQKGRQSTPYYSYNPTQNVIETVYPRTWIIGGSFGLEALGGTLKFEAAWLSDTPVTKTDGSFSTVKSVNWGTALEIFPGDGNARLNLQIIGQKLLNSPAVFDQTESYSFNGTFETPFAEDQWRFKTRFNTSLNDTDVYINPEIAFIGLDSQEFYLELHYFDGDKGTIGGFHEDNSLVTVGWRIKL